VDSKPASTSRRATWRAFLVWMAISLVFFGAAAYLTMDISKVHSRSLLASEPQKPDIGPVETDDFEQHIGIYLKAAQIDKPPEAHYRIIDDSPWRLFGQPLHASVFFLLPAHTEILLVVNHLVDAESCSGGGPLRIESVPETSFVSSSHDYLLTVEPMESESYVECRLNSVAEEETFSRRASSFSSGELRADPPQVKEYSRYRSVTFVLQFDAPDAEEISFHDGYLLPLIIAPESKRGLVPPFSLRVSWSDVRREQLRDVLLVIIGTLVALGATTLIEGLRPVFELFNT
jgi:hypothetical protein